MHQPIRVHGPGFDRRADRCRHLGRIGPAELSRRRWPVGGLAARGGRDARGVRARSRRSCSASTTSAAASCFGSEIRPNAAHIGAGRARAAIGRARCSSSPRTSTTCTSAPAPPSLIHMHGELLQGALHGLRRAAVRGATTSARRMPARAAAGRDALRPHVVWFGEMPLELDAIYAALARCDLFVAIGTSGQVYPAAGLRRGGRGVTAGRTRSSSTSSRARSTPLRRAAPRPGERDRAALRRGDAGCPGLVLYQEPG